MKSYKQFIKETLNYTQKKWVDRKYHPSYNYKHRDLFDSPVENVERVDSDTIKLPLGDVDRTRENEIKNAIEPHGYKIHDYVGGLALDKYGRQVKIPKVLGKLKLDPNLHASDPRVRAKNADEVSPDTHEWVLSRHPYHVAGMSSGRNWNSCMTLPGDDRNKQGGQFRSKVKSDLQHGTLIGYLTKKGVAKPNTELDKDEALARVLFKQHKSPDGDIIYRPERRSYSESKLNGSEGNKYPIFDKATKDFAEKHWPAHPDKLYFKNEELYNDDGSTIHGDKHFDDYSPEQLHQYAKHMTNLKDKMEYEYMKDTPYIHGHYIQILKHPNTSNKTIQHIIDNLGYKRDYEDQHGNYSDILDYALLHDNLHPSTYEDMLDNHELDNVDSDAFSNATDRMLDHKETSAGLLKTIHDNNPDDRYANKKILKHPNIDHEVLDDIYDYNKRDYKNGYDHYGDNIDNLIDVAHHKKTHPTKREEILDDIENGLYDEDSDHKGNMIKGISKHITDPEQLHRIGKLIHNPDWDNYHWMGNDDKDLTKQDLTKTLLKNKNVESPTIQMIHDNLDKTNPEHIKTLKHIAVHPNTSQAILSQLSDDNIKGVSNLAKIRLNKFKINRLI